MNQWNCHNDEMFEIWTIKLEYSVYDSNTCTWTSSLQARDWETSERIDQTYSNVVVSIKFYHFSKDRAILYGNMRKLVTLHLNGWKLMWISSQFGTFDVICQFSHYFDNKRQLLLSQFLISWHFAKFTQLRI